MVPPPALARFVQDVQIYRHEAGRVRNIQALPDGTASLLFRLVGEGRGDLTVIGPRTRALFKVAPTVPACVVVRFTPGAGSIFGVSAHALVDRYVPLEELWPERGRAVLEEMLGAPSLDGAIETLFHALAARRSCEPTSATLVRRALVHWHRDQRLRVDAVAGALGVTSRHLRRSFVENVGVAPKHYARMVRLQRAIGASRSRDWTGAAVHAGYYDHAHLIADFHDLVGLTPSAFTVGRRSPDVLFKPCLFRESF